MESDILADQHMQTGEETRILEGADDRAEALVNGWIAAFNGHDVARIVALYTDDAELFDAGMRRMRKGRDEIERWFTQRFRQMPTIQYTPTRQFIREGEAAVGWVARGHTPALLGLKWLVRPFEIDGVSMFQMREGKICWQRGYYDHLQIVERVVPGFKWLPLKL